MAEMVETRGNLTKLRLEATEAVNVLADQLGRAKTEHENLKAEADRVVRELKSLISTTAPTSSAATPGIPPTSVPSPLPPSGIPPWGSGPGHCPDAWAAARTMPPTFPTAPTFHTATTSPPPFSVPWTATGAAEAAKMASAGDAVPAASVTLGGNPFETAARAAHTVTTATPTLHIGEHKIDHKRAQNVTKLDFDADIKLFSHWELQAEDFLSNGRPDVMKLLEYAAASGVPITKAVEQAMSTPHMNVPDISASIYSGLIYITTGSIMKRLVTEAGKGNGLEIWRLI